MSAKLQPPQIRRISARKWWFVLAALGVALLLGSSLLLWQQSNRSPLPEAAPLTVADLLGNTGTKGYARALEPRPFHFPADHGPHADFRSEWWYLTGNLQTPEGRHFGYQFTIFRSRLTPPSKPTPETSTLWTTAQAYLAHFALTDTESGRFHFFERFSRDSAGLAGAQAEPFRVWVENWCLSGDGSAPDFPLTLHAETPEVALHLKLRAAKPLVLQGDRGFSLKGHQPGNASYYYSYPRMITSGTVTLNGTSRVVSGSSWMDREWSSSALESGQVGWDWFALQFSNGAELMYYQLRRRDGSPDTTSRGIWMAPDGNTTALEFDTVSLAVEASWASPHTGTIYPAAWRLHAPKLGLDATITPRLADQEIRGAIHYWEGAVQVEGTLKGQPLRGVGYVELTGYGD